MAQFQIQIRRVRWSAWFLGVSNGLIIVLGVSVVLAAAATIPSCGRADIAAISAIAVVSCARILAMFRTGVNQKASALTILSPNSNSDPSIRHERRRRYRRWLWWTRFAAVITALQFLGAAYFVFTLMKFIYLDAAPTSCVLELFLSGKKWQQNMVLLFITMVFYVAPVQCFTGSDVLRWRSFYATEDYAWKAHYREVFDNGIREALCCLGRFNYLAAMDEDEVYSVAEFLGDLVTYRASGTGHLEFLAGLALLHRYSSSSKFCEEPLPVAEERIHEAALFHPFAEAAYTGLLLDVGRNPIFFPLSWLCRQGIFAPWARKSRPLLEGDNWWRGHAAAFLKYVKLTADVLRKGRVNQDKCKAAYFIVVLHHLKTVVIAVRGTETPEDLITDGLCRECSLSEGDLDGLVNDNNVQLGIVEREASSPLHYAHSGVVEAARDLYMQVEGNSVDGGFLSSLLGSRCECGGYSLRIVGHSLGGAIAALLGIRLHRQFPNLHVYAYGPLPCVDLEVADASKEFITSIVYNDEFSARLSVGSVMRLQAAALQALSQDGIMDLTTLSKLSRQFMFLSMCQQNLDDPNLPESFHEFRQNSTWQDAGREKRSNHGTCSTNATNASASYTTPFTHSPDVLCDDPLTQFMEAVPCSGSKSSLNLPEMFLPGLLVHIIPQNNGLDTSFWKRWRSWETNCTYKAYIAKRESFRDFIVSPSIFLDHLPWRCHRALKKLSRVQSLQFQPAEVLQIV